MESPFVAKETSSVAVEGLQTLLGYQAEISRATTAVPAPDLPKYVQFEILKIQKKLPPLSF